jgi:hypothetical protein
MRPFKVRVSSDDATIVAFIAGLTPTSARVAGTGRLYAADPIVSSTTPSLCQPCRRHPRRRPSSPDGSGRDKMLRNWLNMARADSLPCWERCSRSLRSAHGWESYQRASEHLARRQACRCSKLSLTPKKELCVATPSIASRGAQRADFECIEVSYDRDRVRPRAQLRDADKTRRRSPRQVLREMTSTPPRNVQRK